MIKQLKKLINQKKVKIKEIFFGGKVYTIYKCSKTEEIFFEEQHDNKIHLKEKEFITAEQAAFQWEAEIRERK